MESTIPALVHDLMERQQTEGLSDKEFAGRMGVTRQAWQLWKRGESVPSSRTLRQIAETFRDLKPAVWDFVMAEDARKLDKRSKNRQG